MFTKLEKTSDKLSLAIWIILFLLSIATYLTYSILQDAGNYSKIVNYSGKIRGNVQRETKLFIAKRYKDVREVDKEIHLAFNYLNGAVKDLKIPFLDNDKNFEPTAVYTCYANLKRLMINNASRDRLINQSEVCWRVSDEQTLFYQKISQRNMRILEGLFYVDALLMAILIGIMFRINLDEIKGDLEIAARYDALTGVFNRQTFVKKFERLLKNEKKLPLSLILFDLDHFKKINDTYGHNMGDKVLKQTAAVVKKALKDRGIVARWGGEEFIVLLPQADKNKAFEIAQELRRLISKLNVDGISISASFGVTTVEKNERLENAVNRADEALYMAKEKGRNRVEVI